MHELDCELETDCELSLHDIHQSIDSTITSIREKHEQVDSIFGDLAHLKRIATDVLEPINQKVHLDKVSSISDLRSLLDRCSRSPPSTGHVKGRIPTPPSKTRPLPRTLSDGRIDLDKGKGFSLPPIKTKSHSATQARNKNSSSSTNSSGEVIELPINVQQTRHTVVISSPEKVLSEQISKLGLSNYRKERLLRRQNKSDNNKRLNIKHFELNRFVDDFEREISVLQETFSTFTQKTLVPLQTFCKQCRNDERADEKRKFSSANESLDQTEFRIVQTMNQIRQLLWLNDAIGLPEHLFCNDHYSKQVEQEVCCGKYPIIRLIPDILQKFNEVLTLASKWLKRDILYVQNAKSGLQRAHRRFLKTEKLWRQARDSQRQLRNEWDNITSDLESQSARLKTMEDDLHKLETQMVKSRRVKAIVEGKLQSSDENIETLVAKHRSLRKQVILLTTKIEARERSRGFLSSRVLSLKADQEALTEKLRISEEYTTNLQTKMEELYQLRDAWSRRYEEKTDPEKLNARLEQTRIRMPLPSLREKTFIIRSGMENLRRALELVERRLSANEVHWSKLCEQLPWPVEELPRPSVLPDADGVAHEGATGNSSFNSPKSEKTERSDSDVSFEKIKEEVITARPQDEKQQTSFMLRLWLHKNGKEATMEKLIHALKASNIPAVAESIERQIT